MKVGEKGQVTIPKDLRDALGIDAGSEVEFELTTSGDAVVVRKAAHAPSRGARLVERLRGRGDVQLSTDEILALTRPADP